MHGREPTTETRAETKLAWALPCTEEDDRKVNNDIMKRRLLDASFLAT